MYNDLSLLGNNLLIFINFSEVNVITGHQTYLSQNNNIVGMIGPLHSVIFWLIFMKGVRLAGRVCLNRYIRKSKVNTTEWIKRLLGGVKVKRTGYAHYVHLAKSNFFYKKHEINKQLWRLGSKVENIFCEYKILTHDNWIVITVIYIYKELQTRRI